MTTTQDVLPVVVRADNVSGPAQGCWNYETYAAIPDDGQRYEVIDGVLYMTPAPNIAHQSAAVRICTQLAIHIQYADLGQVLVAPTDVELTPGGSVVQPDVLVVLNANRGIIGEGRIIGAPDLVVEIASPSTAGYDRRTKQDSYAAAGVREYWIADPIALTVELLVLEGNEFRSLGVFQRQALLPSRVIEAFLVPVEQFFT
jgi:Uma2 family endonuclease